MRVPFPFARRLTLMVWFVLAGLWLGADQGRAATPLEKMLPDTTLAFVEVRSAATLRAALVQSQLGRFWSDPAVNAYKATVLERLAQADQALKEEIGVTFRELFELPHGPAALALLQIKNTEDPLALLAIVDAGKSADHMSDLLARATKQDGHEGAKVSTERFRGTTIHIIESPEHEEPVKNKDEKKANDQDDDEDDEESDYSLPPMVWARQGSAFYFSTHVESLKDVIAHAEGRDDAVAATETYKEVVKKLGADAPVFWFVDLRRFSALVFETMTVPDASGKVGLDPKEVREFIAIIQRAGLSGLRAVAGNVAMNTSSFDTVSRTTLLLQGPAQGLLKLFRLPTRTLEPEPWVPASVATYQSISWDLDNAFVALNELANLIEPGMIDGIQQQFVDPDGGKSLKFKQDLFDPLGDRITIISDFKKPIRGDTEPTRLAFIASDWHHVGFDFAEGPDSRTLLAVALEDSRTLQNTFNTLISLTGLQPKQREFQGTIIYDFDVPEISVPTGKDAERLEKRTLLRGPISVAIAKETLFISREPTLLEMVLRGGGPRLAESAAYRSFARETPRRLSSVFYIRPDEQARLNYVMMKNGQFESAFQGAALGVGTDFPAITVLGDRDKLPEFSVFARYLASAGRFSESSEDGLTITRFSLRPAKP